MVLCIYELLCLLKVHTHLLLSCALQLQLWVKKVVMAHGSQIQLGKKLRERTAEEQTPLRQTRRQASFSILHPIVENIFPHAACISCFTNGYAACISMQRDFCGLKKYLLEVLILSRLLEGSSIHILTFTHQYDEFIK